MIDGGDCPRHNQWYPLVVAGEYALVHSKKARGRRGRLFWGTYSWLPRMLGVEWHSNTLRTDRSVNPRALRRKTQYFSVTTHNSKVIGAVVVAKQNTLTFSSEYFITY